MELIKIIVLFVVVTLVLVAKVNACGYTTCPQSYDSTKIHLHVISHSHDDVGYLSTPDGYADKDVNPLISSVIEALQKGKQRKFVQVEMYYFKRWWQRQTNTTHAIVASLVQSGQLAFANGGWCMNDEASTHYNQIIDQMTLGVEFLRDTFGECAEPKLSWHIDPFGASREQANLFAQMGFDGHVTNRGNSHLHGEFLWNTSLGHSIFTSRLHNHYSAPDGFNFESADEITDANKHTKAQTLVDLGKKWNHDYGSKGHVLIPFGQDFQYKHAERWFSNIDKLIEVVNADHSDVHLHYSSPHCYIKAIRDLKTTVQLPVKSEDYFPYWTGHYSSRPQVKYLDRYVNNLLQSAKQLEVIAELGNTQSLLWEGKNQMAVLQHHDAVTGTSRPFVVIDYKQRVVNAIKSIRQVISAALDKLTAKDPTTKSVHKPLMVYTTMNISSFMPSLDSHTFAAIIYNPIVQEESVWLRIPVTDQHSYRLFDSAGQELTNVSFVPISAKVKSLLGHDAQISHELVFHAKLPALGFTTYFVTKGVEKMLQENGHKVDTNAEQDYVLKGKNFELIVDHLNGHVKSLVKGQATHKLTQKYAYYPSQHSSTSYEFCPIGGSIELGQNTSSVVHVAKYAGFAEITQKISEWVWQTIRVYEDKEFVEFDWVVGPVGDDDQIGKEVIFLVESDLKSNATFYTDANGRQSIKRHRNDEIRECQGTHNAITYNYYPITTRASISDESNGLDLTLITDRSVGASSLLDGALELMIHRRLFGKLHNDINMNDLDDDQKGVIARGKVYLYLSDKESAADVARRASRNIFMQPVISFTQIESISQYTKDHNVHFSALNTKVPENVHLLTLENWGNVQRNEVLVRFENFYQPNDLSKLNTVAHVPLNVFANIHTEQIGKTNLITGSRSEIKTNEISLAPQELFTLVYKVKRDVSNSGCTFKWSKLIDHKLPEHPILAGHELNNTALYICRHKNVTDLIPGKYTGTWCRVGYGGKEHAFNDHEVEVLTAGSGAEGHFQWVPRHGGDPYPDLSFVAGHSSHGIPIYVGRCSKHGEVVGKIDEYFYYPYANKEHSDCLDYEILTC